jgi:hypothetical protein
MFSLVTVISFKTLLHDLNIGEAYLCLSCYNRFIFQINSRGPVNDAREQGTHLIITWEKLLIVLSFRNL